MTALLVWRWLVKLPRIVWVIVFVLAFLTASAFALVHHGRVMEREANQKRAWRDSLNAAVIVQRDARAAHDSAKSATDRNRAVNHLAVRTADTGRITRQKLREQAEAYLADLPTPIVQLIHVDDQQIRRDSVVEVTGAAVEESFLGEREAGVNERNADTAVERIMERKPEGSHGHRLLWIVVGAAGMAGAVLVHAVR